MDHITEPMMRQLLSVGFSYPDYEHHLNYGMLYYYRDSYYYIGGSECEDFTETDILAAQEGLWIPDGSQLLEWLKNNDFTVSIQLDAKESYFHITATDVCANITYTGGGPLLSHALHKVILKICKSNRREYSPEKKLRLPIITEP